MSEFASDLLNEIGRITSARPVPLVKQFELPPQLSLSTDDERPRKNNFAALVLEDGSVGMTYVALDNALEDLQKNPILENIAGRDPLDLANLYRADKGWQRALGLSAINAISQHLLRDKNMLQSVLKPMTDTLPVLLSTGSADDTPELQANDHFGMVGYFGRLVEPLTAMGARITVVELDATLVRSDNRLEVTLDSSKLKDCNKVIITGTTLLNHTIDNILQHCSNAEQILMLGPTASCIPQPLFERGVTLIGGFHVSDADTFIDYWRSGKKWRQCGFRYSITETRN